MEVLTVYSMPRGTKIQMEDWSGEFNFMSYASTIGAYPTSQVNGQGQFSPKRNKTFRVDLRFENQEEAEVAFHELKNGNKALLDFQEHIRDPWKIKYL